MDIPRWKWYLNTPDTWEAMIAACQNAKDTIHFEQYLLSPDIIGSRLIEVLIAKSKEGVKVQCLLDSVGSFGLIRTEMLRRMEAAGIEVLFFNWIIPFSASQEKIWYFRNHRRSLIIDSKIGFTGGICFADDMRDWRETQVELEGEIVKDMKAAFESAWKRAAKHRETNEKESPFNRSDFVYVTNSPLPRKRYLYYNLREAINNAKETVFLTTPYFLPDWKLMRSLIRAVDRGVDVRVLIPMRANHRIVNRAAKTYFDQALQGGISIYRYGPAMIHSKTAVIDSKWSTIGSLNLDSVSLRYNFEANIVSTHPTFSKDIEDQFFNDCRSAQRLTLEEWRSRPLLSRIKEAIVWPLRSFL